LIPGMVLALPLLAIIGIFIYQLIVYLFIAFLVWLMFRIRQIRYPFGRLYVYTAAIAFLPSLIWNLLVVIPAFTTLVISFSILPMIIILIVAYLGLQNLNHNDPKSVHREEKNQL
jgi:amino acid transporter